jgi:hypothetical protein
MPGVRMLHMATTSGNMRKNTDHARKANNGEKRTDVKMVSVSGQPISPLGQLNVADRPAVPTIRAQTAMNSMFKHLFMASWVG